MAAASSRSTAAAHWVMPLRDLIGRSFGTNAGATTGAPHVRAHASVARILLHFVIASVPALLLGLWSAGTIASAGIDAGSFAITTPLAAWLHGFAMLEISQLPGLVPMAVGTALFLPVWVVAALTSLFWAALFAATRRRSVDPGWFATAWLFTLLMPPTVPLHLVVLGMSFAAVIGMHVFGGTGKYIVSPPLLGAVMLEVAYPDAFLGSGIGPFASTWSMLMSAGGVPAEAASSWLAVFLGREVGRFGAPSALACLLGAAYLCIRGFASARIIAAALVTAVALALAASLAASGNPALALPWPWQISIGNFALVVAFVATDPTTTPTTRGGRWLFGALIGASTIAMRAWSEDHHESALLSVMLCMMTIPLIDHLVVQRYIRRRSVGSER